jgi:hypothetical protein
VHALIYGLSYLALPLFGIALGAYSLTRLSSRLAGLGFAFLSGALLLALEAMLFSTIGIPWSVPALAIPLLALSVIPSVSEGPGWRAGATTAPSKVTVILAILGLLHFAFAIASTRSVAADYLLFWGVKGMLFAEARGIDPELLRWWYFSHGMVEYPPLVPIVQAWGVLVTGKMPWITGAVMSAVWIAAAVPVIASLLARAMDRRFAFIATGFWTVAMTNALTFSLSGGNAEAMLLAYISIAAAALLSDAPGSRWITGVALAGAAISKAEGFVVVGGLLIGVFIRDLIERRPRALRKFVALLFAPAASIGLWVLYRWRHDLSSRFSRNIGSPVFHPEHLGAAVRSMASSLDAGSWWIAWVFSLLAVVVGAARAPRLLVRIIPHMAAVISSFAFFFYVYLQNPGDPSQQIRWTLPRISLPALSLLILAAAFASAPHEEKDEDAHRDVRRDQRQQDAIAAHPAS